MMIAIMITATTTVMRTVVAGTSAESMRSSELRTSMSKVSATLSSIVSSLPLRSLHPATTRAVVQQFETLLDSGGRLVQFTYDLRGTHPRLLPGFRRLSSKIVWSNLPPARVETFERI